MRFTDLDAVTIDAFGTLLTLRDPVGALARLTGKNRGRVRAAFEAEVAFYRAHGEEGRDETSLAELQSRCVAVFNRELGSDLSAEAYVGALKYEALEGVHEAVARLQARGLSLAVVANWDYSLHEHLERLGLSRYLATIVTSAGAGVAKPDPAIFDGALERLQVDPSRALHVGDDETDERGAAVAGMLFAPAPLASAVAALA